MQRCEIRTRPWQSSRAFIRLLAGKIRCSFRVHCYFNTDFVGKNWYQKNVILKWNAIFLCAQRKKTRKIFMEGRGGRSRFSDSDSAPVPKFLNPGPAILKIWESDSCSDSGYNHRSNHNLPMFLPKKWPHRPLLLPKWKIDSGSVFLQIFDSGSGSGFERKTQNPAGVDSGDPDPVPPLMEGNLKNTKEVVLMHNSSAHLQRWVVAS